MSTPTLLFGQLEGAPHPPIGQRGFVNVNQRFSSSETHAGSGIQTMILGGVGTAHTTQNHYRLRTTLTLC